MGVRIKRIYDSADKDDGYRVLVDRIWPRGVSRQEAAVDEWARDIAPSPELRRWFGHKPHRFEEFRRRYADELGAQQEKLEPLRKRSRTGTVTLLFAARDTEHNNAAALADLLRRRSAR
jgi:uncharacterized protein YeaO (DUF488 family)